MHPPTQFSSPQPPTNLQALTSYHKLPIQPSLTACSTTHSGSGSVLRETGPPAATLQPAVRPLLEPHPDPIPEQHGIKTAQVTQHLIPIDPHSHSSATGLPRPTPSPVTPQMPVSPLCQSSPGGSICCTSQTTPPFGEHQLYGDVSSQIQSGMMHVNAFIDYVKTVYRETFAWEFCRRWERGEIALQYQLVLLLRLREERISNAKTLEDSIYHPSKDVCHTLNRELEFSLRINILIILEGFDELPDNCRINGSIFMDLISGKLLPLATVLVTSRPWLHREYECSTGIVYTNILRY